MIAYKTGIPLATEIGAQKMITIKHIQRLMDDLHQEGIYTIARIVVFKDNVLALARPDLAVRTAGGAIWKDREGLAWTDPFSKQVWDYNIDVAVAAAKDGFDEIQFDYVRFPDAKGLMFSEPNTRQNRVAAITGFLADARKRLIPYNVFLSADIFGYVIWNLNDTGIGQNLEEMAQQVDYISPMLYPSGFQYGIPGYPNPVLHPHQIVYLSLRKAEERTGLPPVRFRPWLQAFRDYAFGGQPFGGKEIATQIDAAQTFGSDGWMLWNPRNVYTTAGLPSKSGMVTTIREGHLSNPGGIGTGICSRNTPEKMTHLAR
ncbi:putative glycoside hydrolase [Acidithiobacillus thiooxidans]|uniref:putative glycoside hydrolase n=1 Tax=Acidithiobacillus thiooxidans TaxID=930 RepID=UPI00242F9E70|nr:putative glycoside hydrolase [Acidithiobacillus thiooxidans]